MVKFRSWNDFRKYFYYFEDGVYKTPTRVFNWQNAEQSTGKFDKNGKEAFVGDRVLFNHCGMMKEAYIIVHKHTGAFYLDNGEEIYYPLYELERCEKTFEIIGHVHEGGK